MLSSGSCCVSSRGWVSSCQLRSQQEAETRWKHCALGKNLVAKSLTVLLYGDVVGYVTWEGSERSLRFRYTTDYLHRSVVPLSLRLPLSDEVYDNRRVAPYLESLVPENPATRRRWADQLSVSSTDAFVLLSKMGTDCPGAVQFVQEGDEERVLGRPAGLRELGEAEIADRLRRLADDSASWTMNDEHWSLAGQQSKFALAYSDGRWYRATGSAPTTHIFKPGIGRLQHQALVEYATMRAARTIGLDVAHVEFTTFEDQQAVVIERFDRVRGQNGIVSRVHQEDLCSATGRAPWRKYESDGGPMARDMMQLFRRNSTSPRHDAAALVDFMAVNYLAGAPDGHSKNIAMLLLPGRIRLAPLYDLATAFPYDLPGYRTVALSIGGKRNHGAVHPKDWNKVAEIVGMPAEEVHGRVERIARDLPTAYSEALAAVGSAASRQVAARSVNKMAKHCGATLDGFTHYARRQAASRASTDRESLPLRRASGIPTVPRVGGSDPDSGSSRGPRPDL